VHFSLAKKYRWRCLNQVFQLHKNLKLINFKDISCVGQPKSADALKPIATLAADGLLELCQPAKDRNASHANPSKNKSNCPPAVYGKLYARDELCCIAGQERGHRCNIGRLAEAPQRDGGYEPGPVLECIGKPHESLKQACNPHDRADSIYPNLVGCQLDGHGPRQQVHRSLGGVVPGQPGTRPDAGRRAYVEDHPAALPRMTGTMAREVR